MTFNVVTIFPGLIEEYLKIGVLSRANRLDKVTVRTFDIRDKAVNRYGQVDSNIFGTGKGMLLRCEPIDATLESIREKSPGCRIIILSPRGRKFDNVIARELSKLSEITLVSARYEGIDERVAVKWADDEISIGDYVLTGGELAALVVIDSVSRFLEGFIKEGSAEEESFETGLLEYPHFTEPLSFEGMVVPGVLRSGNHKEINRYRLFESLKKTYFNRVEMLLDYSWEEETGETMDELKIIKKKNSWLKRYLNDIEIISKEWKNVGRN